MIYGLGGPVAKLLDADGVVIATITLERPTERPDEDFVDVIQSLGPDVNDEPVDMFKGVRFHGKYVWTGHDFNQTAMAAVLRVAEWRGNGRLVSLQLHTDETLAVVCGTIKTEIKYLDGKLAAEEITMEIWGRDLLPHKPNLVYDRVYRAAGRGAIV